MEGFFAKTLFASENGKSSKVESILEHLVANDLVRRTNEDSLETSPMGRVAACAGIDHRTAQELSMWCRERLVAPIQILETLLLVCRQQELRRCHLPVRRTESRMDGRWTRRLATDMAEGRLGDCPIARYYRSPPRPLGEADYRILKKAYLLLDWISDRDTAELEQAYCQPSGEMARLASEAAWLVGALAEIAEVTSGSQESVEGLRMLCQRLVGGCAEAVLPLARLRVRGLDRSALRRLEGTGILTPSAARQAGLECLRQLLPSRLAEALWSRIEDGAIDQETGEIAPLSPGLSLEIDQERMHILFCGERLRLRPKPFLLLEILIRHQGQLVPYEALTAHVWPEFADDPDSCPYRHQLADHRSRIMRELRRVVRERPELKALGGRVADLIECRRKMGYRLRSSE
jgi:DNA-binding winged helix-turn-helix (wHTH) protein